MLELDNQCQICLNLQIQYQDNKQLKKKPV